MLSMSSVIIEESSIWDLLIINILYSFKFVIANYICPYIKRRIKTHFSTHYKQIFVVELFGSDRSPRRGDLVRACVCACVRACVWDILQNNSENEF